MIQKKELTFEDSLIDYLQNLGGEKQWKYEKEMVDCNK